jgi:hypothetical protein
MSAMTKSVLDDARLAQMRAEAAAQASPFIDPALLREAMTVLPQVTDSEWLARVIGRPVPTWRHLRNEELALAVAAVKADTAHLAALKEGRLAAYRVAEQERAAQAAAAHRAKVEAWERTRARLPVPVTVGHNWTARHLDPYVQGADHIVVQAGLTVGRFRREARTPLCWTPSRSHELRHVELSDDGDDRLPTCKACLRHAERLAGGQ